MSNFCRLIRVLRKKQPMMKLVLVTKIDQLKKGDVIIITGWKYKNKPFEIDKVKVSQSDGTEIIINKKKNRFFNLGMYLSDRSWVKSCHVLVVGD